MEEENKKELKVEKEKISLREKAKRHARKFNREFKKEMLTAVVAAFGFLIALVWKDVITEFVDKISSQSPIQGRLFSALVVTFVCVLGIVIFTRILKVEDDEKK